MRQLLEKIFEKIKRHPKDILGYEDLYHVCLSNIGEDNNLAIEYLKKLSDTIEETMPKLDDIELLQKLFGLHKKVLLGAAPYDFESYILYIEWDREPDKKFYPPRRKVLRQVVNTLQELADDKLDLLAVSLPPGAGKSTLAIFFLTWLAGKRPNEPKLTGSHSNAFIRGVYDECLRILETNGEYLWHDVFPMVNVSSTNAKDCRIDVDKRQRFETLEFTSIGTGNAGLYRASDLLYCDDLVSGIEVALSKERLDKLWETYTTDLRQRKIGNHCKELHIATRWSVHDVIGRLESQYGNSDRAKFIVIPAMNKDDESNFDYDYGVGFTTEFYREQRDIMDDASWRALYMNEPIEREGLLYNSDELQRYFELPDSDPDAVIAVCDTKDRGTDYCVMPIVYQYGQRFFIEDFVCDNSNPDIVEARLVERLLKHHVHSAQFESNSAGGRVAQKVQDEVREKGGITKITTKFTTANKETRIIVSSGYAKEHFLFKDENYCKEHKEYKKAMDMLCGYTMAGKNKNDDVPDAIAMMVDYIDRLRVSKVEVFARPW
uniref:Terminase n=1 Tax=Siphoviridae sp. ctmqu18 TaxID=2825655 RepID=A0A8S5V621_9CAUD|nr:MAG TPA: Terminase [Siphoviridae sp. ctmqu18]